LIVPSAAAGRDAEGVGPLRGHRGRWLVERFHRSLKEEEVCPSEYQSLAEARASIGRRFAGLPEHIRISLGSPEEMEKFVAAFDEVMAEAPQPAGASA